MKLPHESPHPWFSPYHVPALLRTRKRVNDVRSASNSVRCRSSWRRGVFVQPEDQKRECLLRPRFGGRRPRVCADVAEDGSGPPAIRDDARLAQTVEPRKSDRCDHSFRHGRGRYHAVGLRLVGLLDVKVEIRAFQPDDEPSVVALWERCGLVRPWNDPHKDIARKLTEQPELFLVGTLDDKVIASAMVGFDGHRGWVYYLAVSERHRNRSYGRALMQEAERLLIDRGCPKLNLQVRASNGGVLEFYRKLGYVKDETVSLGKRLIPDP